MGLVCIGAGLIDESRQPRQLRAGFNLIGILLGALALGLFLLGSIPARCV